jgi:hypothetical protein
VSDISADQVQAIIDRAIVDAAFRERLAREPAAALAEYDLTADERGKFGSGTARAEPLERRVSKSDLSAAIGVKTGTVDVPLRGRAPRGG